jgi:integrase
VRVARTFVEGRLKTYGKTAGSVREVPLSNRAWMALDSLPPRVDTRLVFPGPRGNHVNLRNFRRREWHPALDAAGVEPRRIYDLRSTFASQALAAGVSVFELARIMGTSVRMIERHYGALLQGSGDAIRGKLDTYLDRLGQDRATASESE